MNNVKTYVVVLLIVCLTGSVYAKEVVLTNPQDSLVVVTSRTPFGNLAGNGFVIGDGTLVITAHHLIFEGSEQGQHEMAGSVTLFSPYLGQGCDAEIVAVDEPLDLAILKVAWPGHPALKLADDKSIASAERMEIVGIPEIIRDMTADTASIVAQSLDVQREDLEVDFVAMRQHTPRFIALSGIGKLGHGWSGSPMLLAGTSEVAGCFVRLHHTAGQNAKTSQGPAITQVRYLLDKVGELKSLHSTKSVIPKPKDSTEVCLLFLRALKHYIGDKYELAFEETQSLIRMRPESAYAYTLAAGISEKQGKHEQAGQYYQKALKLNPEGTLLQILYAQYLSERQPDKALEIFENMWKHERTKTVVALLMYNILSERGDFQRCSDLLSEVTKDNDRNTYLWLNLGACQLKLGKTDDAINSITKAVELMPERGPFRGQLAYILKMADRLDEAEKHYRELLKIEPDNPVVHLWLAQFLAEHRPSATKETLKEAQIALELPAKDGLSKQQIEQFIHDLKSKPEKKP